MAFARLEKFIIMSALVLLSTQANASSKCAQRQSLNKLGSSFTLVGESSLIGSYIPKLDFWSYKNKKWQQVVFQIDQKNARDEYVLKDGLPFTRNTDDFYYDKNDELTLRTQSLGDDFTGVDLPKSLGKKINKKSVLRICGDGGKVLGSLLVVRNVHETKKSFDPAVRFSKEKSTLDSHFYRYFFDQKNAILLGKIYLKQHDNFIPAIESSRFLMPIVTPWFMPDLQIQDVNFDSEIESWQQGPIRTIVAVGVKYSRLFSLIKLHMFSELIFYENRLEIPTKLFFPIDATRFLGAGSGIAYSIRFPKGSDWKIKTNIPPLPQKDPEWIVQYASSLTKPNFYQATGSNLKAGYGFSVKVALDPKSIKDYPPPFIAQQGDFVNKKMLTLWSWLKKIPGDLGVFLDLSKVKKGDYNFGLNVELYKLPKNKEPTSQK